MKGQEENGGAIGTSWGKLIKRRYKRWKRRQIKKKNDPEYQKKKAGGCPLPEKTREIFITCVGVSYCIFIF